MIEPLADLPDGVLGFRFSGRVTREEYLAVLMPALKPRLEGGAKIRLAVVLDDAFDSFESGALWEDVKFGFGTGIEHVRSWERMAIVSDVDWVRHSMALFGWMVPGEAKVFSLGDLDDAKAWLGAP
jgi:hypothetical protein